jgi:hypothetical protein
MFSLLAHQADAAMTWPDVVLILGLPICFGLVLFVIGKWW